MRCQTSLLEAVYIKFVVGGLNFELRKKFVGVNFFDLFELSEKSSRYESLLKEEIKEEMLLWELIIKTPTLR